MLFVKPWFRTLLCLIAWGLCLPCLTAQEPPESVSYREQIEPILRAKCWGCHQPAAARGDYVMTQRDRLLAGGDSELAAITPGDAGNSYLLDMIRPDGDGFAEMPEDAPPLESSEIDLITRWIEAGSLDDSVAEADPINAENPPIYLNRPVVAALDFSPDGSLLAVSGFHEVLLISTADWSVASRLVGMSPRIESVQFSPDGAKLLVSGGTPGLFGELQIWDVASRALDRSIPITSDTVFGGCWSPDSKQIAFGCADNTVRMVDAQTGEQLLYQGAHNDWVLDVVFSCDASHLVSVGRDMTTKLTEVATNRFVDNVTSITPGVLKGGLAAVARHPTRDEIVVGGSDGVPRVYRMYRLTKRVIGDDANLIRQFPPLFGRIQAVDVSRDGKKILAASSLDHRGQLAIFGYEFDTALPDDLKAIMQKVVTSRSAEENQRLQAYHSQGLITIGSFDAPSSGFYSACFDPAGERIVASGDLGDLFLIDANNGQLLKQWTPFDLQAAGQQLTDWLIQRPDFDLAEQASEPAAMDLSQIRAISVEPSEIQLNSPAAVCQLVVTGTRADGVELDVTPWVQFATDAAHFRISPQGRVEPLSDGTGTLTIGLEMQSLTVPVRVAGIATPPAPSFIQDVNPILSRVGCNAGTCHGSAEGRNGFKLSLRGYDPIADVRSFTDDLRGRRINRASPADSLLISKASGRVAHTGGVVLPEGSVDYELVRQWIAAGAPLELDVPRVQSLEVLPAKRIIDSVAATQQLRVVALYTDGSRRDVTRLAFCESGNTEVLTVDEHARATAKRRGTAPVLVRYEGQYAVANFAVMGDRSGFVWQDVPAWNRIDQLTALKWQEMKINPSDLCSDVDFVRRIYLDLTGLPPTADQVRAFLSDATETREKRIQLIDSLIGNSEFVDYWTNKWADLLMVNRKFLGVEGAAAVRNWIRTQVEANVPYDQFARAIVSAEGTNRENPAVAYTKILRSPAAIMESTTHLFLGVRFNCNKCHDHPFERWTQDQYYETAAYFAQVSIADDPASNGMQVGGTSVEPARAVYEFVTDTDQGDITHDRTGAVTPPQFPFPVAADIDPEASRRDQLATWLTSPENPYFARSYVNRIWSYLLGVGLIEPTDDIRAGNPPSNPELLDYLTEQFVGSGFDTRHLIRLICQSRTYQLSVATNPYNVDDQIHFSHALPRRLPAEVVYDAIHFVLGSQPQFPGVEPGTRAIQLPDSGVQTPSGFLAALGRPPRESVCECERKSDLPLGPVLALATGPVVSAALVDDKNTLHQLVNSTVDDRQLIDELYLHILNRPPTENEVIEIQQIWQQIETDHQALSALVAEQQSTYDAAVPQLEADRVKRIERLESELAAAATRLQPEIEQQEAARLQTVAQLTERLGQANQKLDQQVAEWEAATALSDTRWLPLEPDQLSSDAGSRLAVTADRRILVQHTAGPDTYHISAQPAVRRITAVRLEVLTDPSLASTGPGFPSNGNFVVNELVLSYKPDSSVPEWQTVSFQNAQADFAQANFPPTAMIDGQRGAIENGWAVSPRGQSIHWAVLQLATPIELTSSGSLQFQLESIYPNEHQLACFRLSVCDQLGDVELGLPEAFTAILRTPPEARSESLREPLRNYFRRADDRLSQLQNQLAAAEKPLPRHSELAAIDLRLQQARQPLTEPAELQRLKRSLEYSSQQLQSRRLTAAEDLAWALINSPSFLFNH